MTLPSFVVGVIIALLIGALFHVWLDGGGGRLILFLLLSLVGFFAGHALGNLLNWHIFPLGPLNLGLAVLGSLVSLGLGHWLSLVEIGRTAR